MAVGRATTAALAMALLVLAVLLALPVVVRELAERRLTAMTGRAATIGDVDLNVFTRRIAFEDVRIASPGEAPPLVDVPRVEGRFRWLPLLRGRVHLDQVAVVEPAVFLARTEGGALSAADVLAHWRAREGGEPVHATLAHLRIERGRVTFADDTVEPNRRWILQNLSLEAYALTTATDAAAGRAVARFTVADAPAEIRAEALRLRPFQAHADVRVDGLDVAALGAYIPPGVPLRLAGGRFTTRVSVRYDARGFVQASGESTVRNLVLARPGQEAPYISVPDVTARTRDLTFAGRLAVAEAAVSAGLVTVFDGRAPRARALEARDVHLAFEAAPVPAAAPGRVTLSARLAEGGGLDVRGRAELVPLHADVTAEVRGVALALAQVWLPRDAPLQSMTGSVGATLALRYAPARGLTVGGQAWVTGLALTGHGRRPPFVRDDRVELAVADLRVDGAGVALGSARLTASPRIVLRAGAPPLDVPSLTLSARGGEITGRAPTRIEGDATLPHGGRLTARGEARLGTPSAALAIVASGLDARLATAYMPSDAAVRVAGGRLDARLDVAWARGALEADGPLVIRELTVRRAGQDAPLVEHARLDARVDGLRADASGVSVARVAVAGTPVIVDGSASPPLRVALDRLRLEARHVTWPGRRPIELEGEAAVERGGTATLTGTLHPGTLATDVRLAFANVDVTRAAGYLPAAAPVTVEGGRAAGTVRLRRADATPLRLDGGASVTDLALTLTAGPDTRVVDDRLTVTVEGLALSDGAVAAGRLALDASPALGRADEAGQPFALHAELRDLAWPGGAPAALRVRVGAGEGSLEASGTFVPSTRMLEATVTAANAALAPFAPLLPIDAGMGGRLDARLRVSAQPGAAAPVTARGDLTVHDAHLGPADTAPVRAAAVRVEGLALEGRTLEAARVTLAEPSILIEREDDGSFPLRAMLTPDAGGAASPPAPDGAAAPTPASARGGAAWKVAIDDLRVVDGRVRFVDRTTRPFYSEEITELAVTVRDLATDERRRAGLVVQGIVGVDAALDLRGEIAPFASPFFLEVSGELSDFAVPRTNPYLQRFLDWIAQRGQLTTRLHYRIVGTELEATNELVVRRLDVAPARDGKRAEQLVGLPIGLVVALLKDASGDIRFTLPVSGELGSPRFSFGDAVRSALSNVLGRLVTAPFRAIGSVVRGGGGGDAEARIDPVTFPPGNATLTPDAAAHLQRVADFLRASPYVSVAVEGVVSARDVEALRAREVVARIQALQRDEALDSFAEAARRLWRASSPEGPAPPEETRAIVDGLAQREPPPSAAARELAQRRESVSRTHLVEAAGIPRARVVDTPASTPAGVDGEGRVEFRLVPSS